MNGVDVPVDEWTERIRAEYREMPGLVLFKWQMRRLWQIDVHVCDAAIDALVESMFLRRRADNAYVRVDGSV